MTTRARNRHGGTMTVIDRTRHGEQFDHVTSRSHPCHRRSARRSPGSISAVECSDADIALIRRRSWTTRCCSSTIRTSPPSEHLAFGRRFGGLRGASVRDQRAGLSGGPRDHPRRRPPRAGEQLGTPTSAWRLQPSLGSILRCIESPAIGGDTLFADMHAAYDGLPQRITPSGATSRRRGPDGPARLRTTSARCFDTAAADDADIAEMEARVPEPRASGDPHAMRRTDAGGIYVDKRASTQEIPRSSTPDESAELLTMLYAQASYPEYQVRLRLGEPSSIALWDNRSCQRYRGVRLLAQHPSGRAGHHRRRHPVLRHVAGPERRAESPFRGRLKAWSDS